MGDAGEDGRVAAADREPAEIHPEDDQQDDGEPEQRHARAADRDDADDVVGQAVAPRAGVGAEADAERHRDSPEAMASSIVAASLFGKTSATGAAATPDQPRSPVSTPRAQ